MPRNHPAGSPSSKNGDSLPAVAPCTIRPGRPRVVNVYQLACSLKHDEMTPDRIFDTACEAVMAWLADKFPEPIPSCDDIAGGFLKELSGQKLECVHLPDQGRIAFHLSQPDVPFRGRPAVGGRTWTTDIAVTRRESDILFGIRVNCATVGESTAEIFLTRPRVVRDLAGTLEIRQVKRLTAEPWEITSEPELEELHAFLMDSRRALPVVVLSQPQDYHYHGLTLSKWILDPDYLARKLFGYAHVILLPWDLAFRWTERVGKVWSVFGGAARVYRPGLDFEEDTPPSHPLAVLDRILFWHDDRTGLQAERGYSAFLIQQTQLDTTLNRISWGERQFVTELRVRRASLDQEKLAKELEAVRDDSSAIENLREQLAAREAEIRALQEKITELEEEAEEFNDDAIQAGRDRDFYREENNRLRARVQTLTSSLQQRSQDSIDTGIPIPDSLEDLPDWVGEHLVGRLVLHPRANRTLKGSPYNDPERVYRALLLLANEFRDMRIGTGHRQTYEQARDTLGLHDGGSIDKNRAGEYGDTYFVKYPIGTSQTRFLEHHLRHGTSHDPRHCLGIYHFWDSEEQQVVVGSLPGHLQNRMT